MRRYLVDNGSTDETAAYLDEVRRRPGPVGVQVLRNETNRGFVVACSQALAVARGRYLVLLNNDTVLTAVWLDGLLDCARRHGPRVGMVGVVTNRAAPPHPVATDYTDLTGLAPFAFRRRQQYRGRSAEVTRLSALCLLIRREVLNRIGGLDERSRSASAAAHFFPTTSSRCTRRGCCSTRRGPLSRPSAAW